jgi:DNA-binding transcriptional LysR family regulator
MQWDGISEFVHVAETESFTLASKQLALSTAQVSRQVKNLEERLNVKLFYRTTRKVSLTAEGNVFFQHCRAVLDGLDAAERAVTNLQSKPQGKVRLTAPVAYGEKIIVPLLNNFVNLFPEIEIDSYLSNQTIDLVDERFDLAIRLGVLKDSTMMAKKLANRRNYVCASPAYLEKYGMPDSLSELNQHNCLLGTLDYWNFKEAGKVKSIRPGGSIRVNSGFGLLDAALKGIGIVQLPEFYVEEYIRSGDLIPLLNVLQIQNEGIWAVYPQNRHLSPRIRILVDYLTEQLSEINTEI